MEKTFYYNSPVGIFKIVMENEKLVSLKPGIAYQKTDDSIWFDNIKKQLDEYFTGKRKTFETDIHIKGTEFQTKVWKELIKIPYGETRSYKEIAKNIKCPLAQRATGSACNKNPIMLIIPCHRVIGATGKLTGFAGGIELKAYLLKLEHQFKNI